MYFQADLGPNSQIHVSFHREFPSTSTGLLFFHPAKFARSMFTFLPMVFWASNSKRKHIDSPFHEHRTFFINTDVMIARCWPNTGGTAATASASGRPETRSGWCPVPHGDEGYKPFTVIFGHSCYEHVTKKYRIAMNQLDKRMG